MIRYHDSSRSGYTIIELLIAIQLSFLVISTSYFSYLFVLRLLDRWQDKIATERQMATVSYLLDKGLPEITRILIAHQDELQALTAEKDTLHLKMSDSLYYNGKGLQFHPLQFEQGGLRYRVNFREAGSLPFQITEVERENLNRIELIEIHLKFHKNHRSIVFQVTARPLKLNRSITR